MNAGQEDRLGAKERIIEFACPLKLKLILPRDCVLDEERLKERIGEMGPRLFTGLCDACPLYQARERNRD